MKVRFILSFLFSALLFTACGGGSDEPAVTPDGPITPTPGKGSIALVVDRSIIESDGEDFALLTVYYTNEQGVTGILTEPVEIYCNGEEEPLESNHFSTSTAGDYELYAVYGVAVSNTVKVTALAGIPDLPADSDSENLSFRHRMMLLQHTGTDCPNCPRMMEILKTLADDEYYSSLYHHVASHSYNSSDPAYSSAAVTVSRTLNTLGYYPWLTFNLTQEYAHDSVTIETRLDELHKESADAGIAAAASLVDGSILVRVGVKSAQTKNYRVAVWVLEDNISGRQSGASASWQNVHSNCLREMYGDEKNNRIYGTGVGEVAAGESIEYIAAIKTQDKWNTDNCKVMVIVSGKNEFDILDLLNCVVCPLGGSVAYEYN